MVETMTRGKGQVLTEYLPGKTFDFQKAVIALVTDIRGVSDNDLNLSVVLNRVAEAARAWRGEYRDVLRDEVLTDASRFVLINPRAVETRMFPKVFWCQRTSCGRVFDYERGAGMPRGSTCPRCGGKLAQLRFVLMHHCGALQPLSPPRCDECGSDRNMALDVRKSELVQNFKWRCRACPSAAPQSVYRPYCRECSGPRSETDNGGPESRRMNILPHRAGSTFYPHMITLLNIPHKKMEAFFNTEEWPAIAAAKFLDLPETRGKTLKEFIEESEKAGEADNAGVSEEDLEEILAGVSTMTGEEMAVRLRERAEQNRAQQEASSASGIANALSKRTGMSASYWETAGQDMVEAVMPRENGEPKDLLPTTNGTGSPEAAEKARRMGLANFSLLDDFPIVKATYGFSRDSYQPNECSLKPFPIKQEYGEGKYPIFVDQVRADALVLRLDALRVVRWLEANGKAFTLPKGETGYVEPAFFVNVLDGVPLRQTLRADMELERMVFGLLHTMTHLFVKQVSLLCGLQRDSLAEYVIPRALTSAIYCNHSSGATIGALTALYEQALPELLDAVADSRRCVYDPVCREHEGSCHACTHLSEMSCPYFNLNLGRAFLFGGEDPYIGKMPVGFLNPKLGFTGDGEHA